MISGMASHLWQTTLFAGAAGLINYREGIGPELFPNRRPGLVVLWVRCDFGLLDGALDAGPRPPQTGRAREHSNGCPMRNSGYVSGWARRAGYLRHFATGLARAGRN